MDFGTIMASVAKQMLAPEYRQEFVESSFDLLLCPAFLETVRRMKSMPPPPVNELRLLGLSLRTEEEARRLAEQATAVAFGILIGKELSANRNK